MVDSNSLALTVDWIQILLPMVALAVNILLQVLSCRYLLRGSLLKTAVLGFFFGGCSLIVFEMLIYLNLKQVWGGDFIAIFVANLILYSLLGYWYFVFLTLSETAIRTRVMLQIYYSKDGIALDEILKQYNATEVVNKRIERLVGSGQLLFRDGRYYSGKPGLLLFGKVLEFLRHLVFGRKRTSV